MVGGRWQTACAMARSYYIPHVRYLLKMEYLMGTERWNSELCFPFITHGVTGKYPTAFLFNRPPSYVVHHWLVHLSHRDYCTQGTKTLYLKTVIIYCIFVYDWCQQSSWGHFVTSHECQDVPFCCAIVYFYFLLFYWMAPSLSKVILHQWKMKKCHDDPLVQ